MKYSETSTEVTGQLSTTAVWLQWPLHLLSGRMVRKQKNPSLQTPVLRTIPFLPTYGHRTTRTFFLVICISPKMSSTALYWRCISAYCLWLNILPVKTRVTKTVYDPSEHGRNWGAGSLASRFSLHLRVNLIGSWTWWKRLWKMWSYSGTPRSLQWLMWEGECMWVITRGWYWMARPG